MSTDAVAIIGFVALFALMLLRVPVGSVSATLSLSESPGASAGAGEVPISMSPVVIVESSDR